jgi:hypothetical protein
VCEAGKFALPLRPVSPQNRRDRWCGCLSEKEFNNAARETLLVELRTNKSHDLFSFSAILDAPGLFQRLIT